MVSGSREIFSNLDKQTCFVFLLPVLSSFGRLFFYILCLLNRPVFQLTCITQHKQINQQINKQASSTFTGNLGKLESWKHFYHLCLEGVLVGRTGYVLISYYLNYHKVSGLNNQFVVFPFWRLDICSVFQG